MNENVGLIGYGIMGKAIADKLIAKGYSVLVHDKSPEANSNARASGCAVLNAPKEIAMKAKVVLLSLPHPKNVVSVVRNGPDCLLAGTSEGTVLVDTSTVDAETSQANAKSAKKKGVGYLDCPVLGRPSAVGNWTLPTGGDIELIEVVRPVLETFAAKIIPVGPSGHGNNIKILNNLMFGAINSITCEVFSLCKQLGMEPRLLFETISTSGAATVSKLFNELAQKIIENDYSPVFSIDNLHKDVGLGIDMGLKSGLTLQISRSGQKLNTLARTAGFGNEDTSAIVKVFEGEKITSKV